MCRYFFIFLCLMVFSFSASAQDKISVKGLIIDSESQEPVPFVHIINKDKGAGVAGKIDGSFSIKTMPGDTLVFSAVGYSRHSLVVKQLQEENLEIKLAPKSMELNSVNVFAYKDLSSLKRAIIDMDVPIDEKEEIALNLPPAGYMPEGGGIVMMGGLSGLLNGLGFNKVYNQQQKLKELNKEAETRRIIREKYNEKIVKEWTGLKEDEVQAFMKFCLLPDNFVLEASEYQLAVVVHQCLKDYKEMH
jgi:hypothetical protein